MSHTVFQGGKGQTLPTCFHLQDGKSHDDSESLQLKRAPQGCFEKNVVLCWFLQHEVDMKP